MERRPRKTAIDEVEIVIGILIAAYRSYPPVGPTAPREP